MKEIYRSALDTATGTCIHVTDEKSGPFATSGNLRVAMVDCLGHLGGLLTIASGRLESDPCIIYTTSVSFILECLKTHEYNVSTERTLS